MKIEMKTVILDVTGEPVKKDKNGKEALTLSDVCVNALLAMTEADKNAAGTDKAAWFSLALAIQGGKDDLTIDEAKLIKDRVGKMYNPTIVGRTFALLEKE